MPRGLEGPRGVLRWWAFSYERGTPVLATRGIRVHASSVRVVWGWRGGGVSLSLSLFLEVLRESGLCGCEDRTCIGTGPRHWAVSGSIHPKGDSASWAINPAVFRVGGGAWLQRGINEALSRSHSLHPDPELLMAGHYRGTSLIKNLPPGRTLQ